MRHQQGSALMAVLVVISVITLIGVIAIRQGLASLNIATNAQVQSVLFQTADRGIDQIYLNLDTEDEVKKGLEAFGILGLPQISGNEIVICARRTLQLTNDLSAITVAQNRISDGDLQNLDTAGYCDVTANNDYLTNRQATMTQLALVVPTDRNLGTPYSTVINATDQDLLFGSNSANATNQQAKPLRVRVYSTSVAPALATNTSSAKMNACFQKMNDANKASEATTVEDQETVVDCLTKEGVPFAAHTEEYAQVADSDRPRDDTNP